MSNAKRQYETTFIANASLDDVQVDGVINRVQKRSPRMVGRFHPLTNGDGNAWPTPSISAPTASM